jgi:hypothetical protein
LGPAVRTADLAAGFFFAGRDAAFFVTFLFAVFFTAAFFVLFLPAFFFDFFGMLVSPFSGAERA